MQRVEPAGSSSRYVSGILSAHADALLAALDTSRSTRNRVERALVPLLHTGTASMDTVARHLGLSRQTLFRRPKAEGTTFERVLDELRHTMALHVPALDVATESSWQITNTPGARPHEGPANAYPLMTGLRATSTGSRDGSASVASLGAKGQS